MKVENLIKLLDLQSVGLWYVILQETQGWSMQKEDIKEGHPLVNKHKELSFI